MDQLFIYSKTAKGLRRANSFCAPDAGGSPRKSGSPPVYENQQSALSQHSAPEQDRAI
jgi:hypothetical protein